MKKKKLIILRILCIISLLITIVLIQRTYARYYEKVDTIYKTDIKRWLIKVNGKDIKEESTLSSVMQPVLVDDENMNNNLLIPGRTGYFEMELDYTYVDLAFEYEFTIEQLNTQKLADFKIYGYEIIDGDESTLTETNTIKGIIDPDLDLNTAGERKREIRVLFRWNDGEGSTMDNKADTQFKGEKSENNMHTLLNYQVTLKFNQYVKTN